MNLKRVVALMGVLGLVSLPAFAATDANTDTSMTDTTNSASASSSDASSDTTMTSTSKKHVRHHYKHHKKVHHHHPVQPEPIVHHDYKDMGPAVEVCSISHSAMIMNDMTQSMGRSMPNPCNQGWFNRVQLSGGINAQNAWGNRNANLMGEGYQHIALNDAYLNLAAAITDWSKAFMSISYNTETINDPRSSSPLDHVAEYSSAYSNNVNGGATNQVQIEQAYLTLANFDMSPIFVQIGKQFQDFSRYEIHPIERTLTQVMSETLATSAKIGFIAPMGFNGSLYVFDDPIPKVGQSSRPANYGAALGIDQPSDQFGWDLGVAYLYNLIGVNDVAYNVGQFNFNRPAANNSFGYVTRVSGLAAYGDINIGPFVVNGRYTTALQRFNVNDLPKDGVANILTTGGIAPGATGAKPWAAGVQAGYGFEFWGKNQNVYLGWNGTNQAGGLLLPKNRWLVGYGVDVWQNTNFGVEWDYDNAYSLAKGGTGNNTNLVNLRAGVKFG